MTMLLAAPALLLIVVVFGWPMLRYAWLSFHADSVLTGLEPVANGGANWWRLAADQRFWLDAGQTARFALTQWVWSCCWPWPLRCCCINAGAAGGPFAP